MRSAHSGLRGPFVLALVLALLLAGALIVRQQILTRRDSPPATTQPVTAQVITIEADSGAAPPDPLVSYMDLILRKHSSLPTTRPLVRQIDLRYAAHFVLHEPVHLEGATGRGSLWITHPDAEPTSALLSRRQWPYGEPVLTRERPVYIHWALNDSGYFAPHLVCPAPGADGFELISAGQRRPIGRGVDYDWSRAVTWDDKIVVPTSIGISILFPAEGMREVRSPPLVEQDVAREHAGVQFQFDLRGLLAWIPPRDSHPGSDGAVRFFEDQWVRLTPEAGWHAGILHLVPLLDGSVLQILSAGSDTIRLSLTPLDTADVDEQRILQLIAQLSSPDPDDRENAFKELAQYGPALWPIADRLIRTELPETQARLRALLKARISPLLGHMDLVGGKLRLVSRHPDGGALFYAERGVRVPRGQDEARVLAPAWLSIRPGDSFILLDHELVRDLDPDKVRITPWNREWIVTDEVHGARRYIGNRLAPILRKRERAYTRFVGIDGTGRFVLQQEPFDGSTLIIDPTLPDPTPRLPVWVINVEQGEVGWDRNNWPAMKATGAAALGANEWRFLDLKTEPFFSRREDVPPVPPLPATRPAVANDEPTTAPADVAPDETPLLVDDEGNYYFDGRETLKLVRPDGTIILWPLPPTASGNAEPHLVRTRSGHLFLFNQPGRLLRIRPASDDAEPFELEATFTRKVPNTAPTRLWLDPFDRIVIAHGSTLTILFPQGYIPQEIMTIMPAADQQDALEE